MSGINIYSGEKGLGAALTNPTEMGRSKGNLDKAYRVLYKGVMYPDAEAAYQANKLDSAAENDEMMIEVISLKFKQHPDLADEVRAKGGAAWLARCSHFTYAKTLGAQSWEGQGEESRFIRNLVQAWIRYETGDFTESGQTSLF